VASFQLASLTTFHVCTPARLDSAGSTMLRASLRWILGVCRWQQKQPGDAQCGGREPLRQTLFGRVVFDATHTRSPLSGVLQQARGICWFKADGRSKSKMFELRRPFATKAHALNSLRRVLNRPFTRREMCPRQQLLGGPFRPIGRIVTVGLRLWSVNQT
jgi:hypothetical protein